MANAWDCVELFLQGLNNRALSRIDYRCSQVDLKLVIVDELAVIKLLKPNCCRQVDKLTVDELAVGELTIESIDCRTLSLFTVTHCASLFTSEKLSI